MDFLWQELIGNSVQRQIFEERLKLELTPAHGLFGKGNAFAAVAKSERTDDVLFWDGKGSDIVHLTGAGSAYFPRDKTVHQRDITAYSENDYLYG